jgi:hypothetical protein
MENQETAAGGIERLNWHPAFVEAIQMELVAYKDNLEFQSEYQLTSEPLRIDCVIIKKPKEVVVDKNIAAIFREFNILEYKSPDDYVSVADFYKVYGYACLYSSLEKVPITDITLSFVESRHPSKLLEHLKKVRKFTVEKTASGIYTVNGDILPIQVIESPKLSTEENLWLKSLSKRLDLSVAGHVNEVADMRRKGFKVAAYLDVIIRANKKLIKEIYMGYPTMEEVLKEIGFWQKAERENSIKIAQKMKDAGKPIEEITEFTGLTSEEIQISLN